MSPENIGHHFKTEPGALGATNNFYTLFSYELVCARILDIPTESTAMVQAAHSISEIDSKFNLLWTRFKTEHAGLFDDTLELARRRGTIFAHLNSEAISLQSSLMGKKRICDKEEDIHNHLRYEQTNLSSLFHTHLPRLVQDFKPWMEIPESVTSYCALEVNFFSTNIDQSKFPKINDNFPRATEKQIARFTKLKYELDNLTILADPTYIEPMLTNLLNKEKGVEHLDKEREIIKQDYMRFLAKIPAREARIEKIKPILFRLAPGVFHTKLEQLLLGMVKHSQYIKDYSEELKHIERLKIEVQTDSATFDEICKKLTELEEIIIDPLNQKLDECANTMLSMVDSEEDKKWLVLKIWQ